MPQKLMLVSRNLLLFLCPLLAVSCSSCDYNEPSGAQSQAAVAPPKLTDASTPEGRRIPEEIAAITPEGWRPVTPYDGGARYGVTIDDASVGGVVTARGHIASDGSLDGYLQPIRFSATAEISAKKKFSEEAKAFPNIRGYTKFADRRQFGFDARLQMPLLSARYVNRELGIFCRMNRPGDARCVWGEADGRFLLTFDSLKSETVLPYILNIAKQGR